jgi:hypothetical protein
MRRHRAENNKVITMVAKDDATPDDILDLKDD